LQTSLSTYGTTNVLGIAVGNEYVLASTQAGDTLENATSRVVSKMNEVRTDLTALGYNLLVGTSDAGGMVSQTMVNAADL
jgi:exo-beta-1,3-glucanase (GH17 family)